MEGSVFGTHAGMVLFAMCAEARHMQLQRFQERSRVPFEQARISIVSVSCRPVRCIFCLLKDASLRFLPMGQGPSS